MTVLGGFLVWTEARVTLGQMAVHCACLSCTVSAGLCLGLPPSGHTWQESGFPPHAGQARRQRQRHHLIPPSSHLVSRPPILVSPAGLTDQKMRQELQTSSGRWLHHASVVPPAVRVLGEGAERGSRRWTLWQKERRAARPQLNRLPSQVLLPLPSSLIISS